MKKILILTCSTGEGHNSAAHAIQSVLEKRGIPCVLEDPVSFQSERMKKLVASLYNNTIRRRPEVFGAVYKLGDIYSSSKLPSPVYWANAHYSPALKKYILENQFTSVICTHLYGLEAMTAICRKGDFTIPFYGILTDYTSIPFMMETEPNLFFAPTEETQQTLLDHGFASDRVCVSGIPVDTSFRNHPSKDEAKELLGLPQSSKIFLVMTGGVGCENMEGLCDQLLKDIPEDGILLVMTGKNAELKLRLDEKYKGNASIQTIAFTRQVPVYMAAADVLLTKPGGLSTTEAAVANVPLVHIHAIPGCETCNAEFFSGHGMSFWAKNDQEAVNFARKLVAEKDIASHMLFQQRTLINPNAADLIVDRVVGK